MFSASLILQLYLLKYKKFSISFILPSQSFNKLIRVRFSVFERFGLIFITCSSFSFVKCINLIFLSSIIFLNFSIIVESSKFLDVLAVYSNIRQKLSVFQRILYSLSHEQVSIVWIFSISRINGVSPQCGQFTVNLRKIVRFYPNYIL